MDASGHAAALAKVLDGMAQTSLQDGDSAHGSGSHPASFLRLSSSFVPGTYHMHPLSLELAWQFKNARSLRV